MVASQTLSKCEKEDERAHNSNCEIVSAFDMSVWISNDELFDTVIFFLFVLF